MNLNGYRGDEEREGKKTDLFYVKDTTFYMTLKGLNKFQFV